MIIYSLLVTIYFICYRNTVKKPFVVQKTPKRRKTFSPSDDVGLNTTFTMDTSGEGEVDDDVVNVEKRIPKMNAIEESIVAESLQQMIARLDKVRLFLACLSICRHTLSNHLN